MQTPLRLDRLNRTRNHSKDVCLDSTSKLTFE